MILLSTHDICFDQDKRKLIILIMRKFSVLEEMEFMLAINWKSCSWLIGIHVQGHLEFLCGSSPPDMSV